jgi:hypothetical protein
MHIAMMRTTRAAASNGSLGLGVMLVLFNPRAMLDERDRPGRLYDKQGHGENGDARGE